MAIIRALAFHAPEHNGILTKDYLEDLLQLGLAFRTARQSFKTPIWTRRIVLPNSNPIGSLPLHDLALKAEEVAEKLEIDYIALPFGKGKIEEVGTQMINALRDTSTTFFSIKAADIDEDLSRVNSLPLADLVKRIAEAMGPEACARFAIAFGNQPETAYFPDAASVRKGFSISSRYVPDLRKGIETYGVKEAERPILEVLSKLDEEARDASVASGLDYLGIDPSISPWMDESIALLISQITGDEFGSVGTHHIVNALNSAILKASNSVKSCGFKEIMLPVAEDDDLKRLASTSRIDLRLLVSLISVCVAGLDMVLLPLSTPDKKLAELLLDVFSIAQSRKKALGVRLLFADSKPGEWVKVGRFGSVPVMSI